jgi:TRAP transporter TAXI family solute receptor
MDGLGLDAAKDFQPVYLERAGDGPAMVLDGRVAALWGGDTGWPGFTTVAKSEKGARFIAPDAAGIKRILAKHSFLKEVTQAAGSFPGQAEPIPSVGSWSFVLARPDLDDAMAWRLAKALHELERLGSPPQQLVDTTARNTVAATPADRLHPGVARYFREIGLIRP